MKLCVSKTPLSLDRIKLLPRSERSFCWRGSALTPLFEWCLACDSTSLWFYSRVPGIAWCNTVHPQGSFVEGLWEDGDVAEIFLGDGSGRYQEFNLSPTGAWWTCQFQSYRERSAEQPLIKAPLIKVARFASHWEVVLAVSLEQIPFEINDTLRAHVAGIVQRPSQTFLSSSPVQGIEPDFHHQDCFQRVVASIDGEFLAGSSGT